MINDMKATHLRLTILFNSGAKQDFDVQLEDYDGDFKTLIKTLNESLFLPAIMRGEKRYLNAEDSSSSAFIFSSKNIDAVSYKLITK